jgi:hypothetical protein
MLLSVIYIKHIFQDKLSDTRLYTKLSQYLLY